MDAERIIRLFGEEKFMEVFGPRTIFVFESDLRGNHTEGDTLIAVARWGTRTRMAAGFYSHSLEITTTRGDSKPLPLAALSGTIDFFLTTAETWSHFTFRVGRIGCGLAGYTNEEMAPMFATAPDSCEFSPEWSQ